MIAKNEKGKTTSTRPSFPGLGRGIDFLFVSFSCVKTRKGEMKGSSFLLLMEEKKQKKIKAAGLPANYAGAPKDYLPRKFKTT